ncbi:MAG: zinc ribbon domain-containing protein [Thermoleophilia bacterium]
MLSGLLFCGSCGSAMEPRDGALGTAHGDAYVCAGGGEPHGCGMPPLPKRQVDHAVVEFLVGHVVDREGRRAAWHDDHLQRVRVAEDAVDLRATELADARRVADFGRPRFIDGQLTGAQLKELRAAVAAAEDRRRAAGDELAGLRAQRVPDDLAQLIPGRLDGLADALESGLDTPEGQALAHRLLRGVYERFTAVLEEPAAGPSPRADVLWNPDAPPISADHVARLLDGRPPSPSRDDHPPRPATAPADTGPAEGGLALYLLPDLHPEIQDTLAPSVPLRLGTPPE